MHTHRIRRFAFCSEVEVMASLNGRLVIALFLLLALIAFACWNQLIYPPESDDPLAIKCKKLFASDIARSGAEKPDSSQRIGVQCVTGKPCDQYTDDVDFRIIVITYNRAESLSKLLHSLDDLELDGDRAAMEIWIDVNDKGQAREENVETARSFQWKRGPTRVHIQSSHAGIMGQWIDTWRPRPDSREIGIILEDDISVSPMAYRWLKAVHKAMANRTDFVGATLNSDQMSILSSSPKGPLAAPINDTILMYKCLGTWGFSPKPEHWRRFQVSQLHGSRIY
jgi:hypothetical protein